MRGNRGRGYGADGTDGIDPHNRYTKEIDTSPKKEFCIDCGNKFFRPDLSKDYVCRGCRGLGTKAEEGEKRMKKANAAAKKKLADQEAKKLADQAAKKLALQEAKKAAEEKKIAEQKFNTKLLQEIKNSNFIFLFDYLVENRWYNKKVSHEKKIINSLVNKMIKLRENKSEDFNKIFNMICSKAGKTSVFREILPELFLSLFTIYPELLSTTDENGYSLASKGFDHWVKYERENITNTANNLENNDIKVINRFIIQKKRKNETWTCIDEASVWCVDTWIMLNAEKCPTCESKNISNLGKYEGWSNYTLKEFGDLINNGNTCVNNL
jgi:hypothetical protein